MPRCALLLSILIGCADPEPAAPPRAPVAPVAADDGADAPVKEAPEEVDQAPRVKSITLSPAAPVRGQDVTASVVAVDRETEVLDVDFVWVIDGDERYELTGEVLAGTNVEKGTSIAVKATVDDGTNEVTELSDTILAVNSAPTIDLDAAAMKSLDGFQVTAQDLDGDRLSYAIEGAPEGLTIDGTGVLHYKGSESEPGGAYELVIVVEDGDGGFARWPLKLSVAPGKAAERVHRGGAVEDAGD